MRAGACLAAWQRYVAITQIALSPDDADADRKVALAQENLRENRNLTKLTRKDSVIVSLSRASPDWFKLISLVRTFVSFLWGVAS